MVELVLPYAVIAALWLPRVRDTASVRRAVAAIADDDEHLVESPDGSRPLVHALRDVVAPGGGNRVLDAGALLPAPGHVAGVPAVALPEALDAEQCLLVRTTDAQWAAVPEVTTYGSALEPGTLVRWHARPLPAGERAVPTLLGGVGTLGQARRELGTALLEALDELEALDVARWRPDAAAELADLGHAELPDGLLPPGLPERQVDVLTRAARLLAITELAREDDGAAVTAAQSGARSRVLSGLALTARRGMAAASVSHRA
ncbi:hypothetical protein [Georgenia faecalis]|uniref:DUF2254 domain-containing protein n=1 Tax=Georgenia faecalis TaxID=2483799 RepID=A0ABV9DDT6_9MICO|nr:hypothetical protein [Georgenia faecalis]